MCRKAHKIAEIFHHLQSGMDIHIPEIQVPRKIQPKKILL
jgi:hypothetical protein